jgi:IS605 OrfB family transposase
LRNTKKQEDGFILRNRKTLIPFSQDFKYTHKDLGEGIPLKLPQALVGKIINEVKIIPTMKYGKQHFEIHVTYGIKHKAMRGTKGHYLSIDMGLKNTMACFDSFGESFIVQDKDMLAFNARYNKKQDRLKSQKDNLLNQLKKTTHDEEKTALITYHIEGIKRSQMRLAKQRKDKVKDWLNRASLVISRYALDANIDTVIMGYNKNQKQNINIGKKNNRRFVELPFGLLRQRLKDRLNELGIAYIEQEESYTSKCSFLDKEFPRKYKKGEYLGNRIQRGLFKSSNQTLINADINAAANILVKHLYHRGILNEWYDHSFERASQGIVNFPCLVSSTQITQRHKLSTNVVWTELTKSSVL